jgi:ribulose-phosphate 3-epimerase
MRCHLRAWQNHERNSNQRGTRFFNWNGESPPAAALRSDRKAQERGMSLNESHIYLACIYARNIHHTRIHRYTSRSTFMTSSPFTLPPPLIAPSILSADFSNLQKEIDDVLSAGGHFLHLDVMDGHFVPNISFGPPVIKGIRKASDVYLDAHLMISDPLRYAPAIIKAGANNITFHIEVAPDPVSVAKQIRALGCHVGITLNPATSIESIYPVLDHVDLILIMSVVPGFSGQKFMPEILPKVRDIKKRIKPHQRIEIDGGINPETIKQARNAGADLFVVASAIFDQPDRKAAIEALRHGLNS